MTHDLHSLIAVSIADNASRPALITPDGQRVTYEKLGQTIDAFTARASAEGIAPGQKILVDVENYVVELCLMFALSRLGTVIVMGAQVREILDAGIELDGVISIDLRANTKPRNILFDTSWFTPATGPRDWPGHGRETDTAVIASSSGTTGKRKFMAFSLARLAARTESRVGAFNQPEAAAHKKRLVTIGCGTVVGFVLQIRNLQGGGLVAMPVGSAHGTLELVADLELEEIFTVPTLAVGLLNAQKQTPVALPLLQRIEIGGGAVSGNVCRDLMAHLCPEIIVSYGASEIGHIAIGLFDRLGDIEGAIGHLGPWVEGQAFDDAKNPLAAGKTGLLGFKVPDIMRIEGYLNPDAGQREVFRDGWFFPGDLGRVGDDGLVVLSGRATELINTGGNKIAPDVIEAVVAGKFGVIQAGAVGVANDTGMDDILVALVSDGALDLEAARACLAAEFGDFVTVRVIEVKTIPANAGGNIDRRKLKQLFMSS